MLTLKVQCSRNGVAALKWNLIVKISLFSWFHLLNSFSFLLFFALIELRDMKRQEQKLREKCKQEDGIVSAVSLWANEILPNFDTM